jgi:heme-degrading monooxygenase HmoA
MPETYTTGTWKPHAGHEEQFVEAWKEFAGWAAGLEGAGRALLARDLRSPDSFVSFVAWESLDAVRAWKGSEEFKPRMGKVQEHVDKFAPTELEVVAYA